jgi:hypothetical protein
MSDLSKLAVSVVEEHLPTKRLGPAAGRDGQLQSSKSPSNVKAWVHDHADR